MSFIFGKSIAADKAPQLRVLELESRIQSLTKDANAKADQIAQLEQRAQENQMLIAKLRTDHDKELRLRKELEKDVISVIPDLRAQLQGAVGKIHDLLKANECAEADVATLKKELAEQHQERKQAEEFRDLEVNRLAVAKKENQQLRQERDDHRQQISLLKEGGKVLEEERRAQNDKLVRLQESQVQLKKKVEEEQVAKEQIQQENRVLIDQADHLSSTLESLRSKLEDGRQQNAALRQKCMEQSTQLQSVVDHCKSLQEDKESGATARAKLDEAAKQDLRMAEDEVVRMREALIGECKKVAQLEGEAARKQDELRKITQALEEVLREKAALQNANNQLRTDLEVLQTSFGNERTKRNDLLGALEVEKLVVEKMRQKFDELKNRAETERRDKASSSNREQQNIIKLRNELETHLKEMQSIQQGRDSDATHFQKALDQKGDDLQSATMAVCNLQKQMQEQINETHRIQRESVEKGHNLSRLQADMRQIQHDLMEERSDKQRLQLEHTKVIETLRRHSEADRCRASPTHIREVDKEVSRLREEVAELHKQILLERKNKPYARGLFDNVAEGDRLRQECRSLSQRLTAEEQQLQRLKQGFDDRSEELRRLKQEAFLSICRTDICSAAEVISCVMELNEKINYLANALADQWDVDVLNDHPAEYCNNSRFLLEPALGTMFLDMISDRQRPRDDKDITLGLFALQASAVQWITDVLRHFCALLTDCENGVLGRIYEQMCQAESRTSTSRWRSMAHTYARASIPNYASVFQDRLTTGILERFSAVQALMGWDAGAIELGEDYASELKDISERALALSLMLNEEAVTTKYAIHTPLAAQQMEPESMEDALEEGYFEVTSGSRPVACTVEMGLVEIGHPYAVAAGSPENRVVHQKAKVLTLGSVDRFRL